MENFIKEFVSVVYDSTDKLKNIQGDKNIFKTSPNAWSSKEILGHLIDSSINNIKRIVVGQTQGNLIFDGYNQNEWVELQNYQNRNWDFLIDLWKLNNLHFIQIVETIPHSVLIKEYSNHNLNVILFNKYSDDKPKTLELLIRDYFDHMKHHLNKIFEMNSK